MTGIEDVLSPGDRFPFHPLNFKATEECEDEEEAMEAILEFAFHELGFDGQKRAILSDTIDREKGEERIFKTNRPNVFLGFDGVDWWIVRV